MYVCMFLCMYVHYCNISMSIYGHIYIHTYDMICDLFWSAGHVRCSRPSTESDHGVCRQDLRGGTLETMRIKDGENH